MHIIIQRSGKIVIVLIAHAIFDITQTKVVYHARLHGWRLGGIDKSFHHTHDGCNYLSMMALKLNHVS